VIALNIGLAPWLNRIIKDGTENREFYLTKGLGAGGTYAYAIWHYALCLFNSKSKFSWSIAPTFQQVQDTLIPTFADVLQNIYQLKLNSDYEIITSGRPRIIFKTGQELHFKSAKRAETFVGPSISHFGITEPGLCPIDAFNKAAQRLRCPKATRLQKLFEGTPEGLGNHWEKIANFAEGKHPDRNAIRIRLDTAQNPHLRESYVDNLIETYSYDPAKLESYLHGNFVPFTKGTAYWDFRESRNVTTGLSPSPRAPLLLCFDFQAPLSWVVLQRHNFERNGIRREGFAAVAESSATAAGLMDSCIEFIEQFNPFKFGGTSIEVYGDPSGYAKTHQAPGCDYDMIIQYLKPRFPRISICAANHAPEVRHRLERVNALFAYETYVIGNQCRNLIHSHSTSSLKPGTWKLDKPKDRDFTHFSDAVGYPLFQLTKDLDLERPGRKHKFGTNN
jgi:hypothetical protein